MTVKNPDADASEWHAQKARSGTPRTQGVSPLTRPASLTRLRVDTGSINTTTDMNPGRTPRGTLTLAGAAPSSVSRVIMSTLSIRTRRWTRKEYDRLVEPGFMRGQISRTTDRQPGGSCPRGLSPAGPRGVSALRLEVPPRTGAEARGERLAARRPDRADRRAAAPRRHRRRDRGARRGSPPAPSEHPRRGRRGPGRARVAGPASQDRRRAHRGREAPRSVRDDDVRPRHAGAGPLRAQADRRGIRRADGPRLRRSRERRPTGR